MVKLACSTADGRLFVKIENKKDTRQLHSSTLNLHLILLLIFTVSLENVLLDVKELHRGMELTKREYSMHGHNTMLKEFIAQNESKLKKLQDDAKIAQVTRTRPAVQFAPAEVVKMFSKQVPLFVFERTPLTRQ